MIPVNFIYEYMMVKSHKVKIARSYLKVTERGYHPADLRAAGLASNFDPEPRPFC